MSHIIKLKSTLRGPFFGQDEAGQKLEVFHPDPLSVLHLRSAARRSGLHLGRRIARQLSARHFFEGLTLTLREERHRSLFILAKKRIVQRQPRVHGQQGGIA